MGACTCLSFCLPCALDDSKSPHHHSHTHAHVLTHHSCPSSFPTPHPHTLHRPPVCHDHGANLNAGHCLVLASSSIPPAAALPCVSLGVEEWNEGVTLARSTDQPAAPQDTETWRPTQSLPGDNGQRPTTRSSPLPHVSSLGHKMGGEVHTSMTGCRLSLCACVGDSSLSTGIVVLSFKARCRCALVLPLRLGHFDSPHPLLPASTSEARTTPQSRTHPHLSLPPCLPTSITHTPLTPPSLPPSLPSFPLRHGKAGLPKQQLREPEQQQQPTRHFPPQSRGR